LLSRLNWASKRPGPQLDSTRRVVDPEQLVDRRQVRGKADDGADVQVLVRPAVSPLTDAGREGVIHRRVAERALDAYGFQATRRIALVVEDAGQADYRAFLEERERCGRIIEVDLPCLPGGDKRCW
jgi:hypothetical protein